MTETETLCQFLSSLTYEDIPSEVIYHAKASILNALGCALGGAAASSSVKARKALLPLSTSTTSTVLATPERTDLQTAAFLNGISLTNADYDDTHLRTVIHPSGAVLCAILAWGEVHKLSGKEILLAFIVGVEAQLRIGNSISPGHYTIGWHVTGTTGTFGAAAGVAKLLGLSAEQFYFALGHAASMAGGTRAANGTDTKTLHMGRGAQNGILAATLAHQNFNTGKDPITYWAKLMSPTVNMNELPSQIGKKWEIMEITWKPYPCGIVIHPLIDACLAFHNKKITMDEIEKVEVGVTAQCMRLCFIRHPTTSLEAVFSLYHGCAVALLKGADGPFQFSDQNCNYKAVAEVRDKVEAVIDDSLRDDETWLEATLKDGTVVREYVAHAKGSLENPLTKEELQMKFVDQAEGAIGWEKCKKVIEISWNLEEIDDISMLLALCNTS